MLAASRLTAASRPTGLGGDEFNWGLWAVKWSAIFLGTAAALVAPYAIRYYIEQRR